MGQYTSSREQVVSTCCALLKRGYLRATEGNVSVRVPCEEAFAITPSSYDYAKMRGDEKKLEKQLVAARDAADAAQAAASTAGEAPAETPSPARSRGCSTSTSSSGRSSSIA
jgi:ribulose-5-phosphate 4-epimerase/fuculose-1-phosphate aldolase